jgi:ribonuclease VapC
VTLDTSAILAVLLDETERADFVSRIEQAGRRLVSAVTVLEAGMVLEGRKGDDAGSDLDLFLQRAAIDVVPFDQEQLNHARTACRGPELRRLCIVRSRAMVWRAAVVQGH